MAKAKAGSRSSAETIANALREQILLGRLEEGHRLRQDALAQEFGVSHIPVREALRQLAAEGLVVIRPQQGAVVAALLPEAVRELLEIRAALEIQAVRWALPNCTPEVVERAEAILAESEATDDVSRWMDCNWRFHAALYERAGRPQLVEIIRSLNVRIERVIRLLIALSDYRRQAQEEHRAILAAFRMRNETAVTSLLAQHLHETATALVRILEEYRKPSAAKSAA
jgi:DNA-binding GntR family transcriptional regulator